MYKLIESVKQQAQQIENVCENVQAAPFKADLLFESADKYLGGAIGALNHGKNPFESMPGSLEVLAGLILLAKDSNRQALNLDQKKFDVISQYTSEKDSVKKFVANQAKKYGPSLIKNLNAAVMDENRRPVLKKTLVHAQNVWSQARQKLRQGAEREQHNQEFSDSAKMRA